MSYWTDKRDKAEVAARKAAQESLDTVSGMDSKEKGVLLTVVVITLVFTALAFGVWMLFR